MDVYLEALEGRYVLVKVEKVELMLRPLLLVLLSSAPSGEDAAPSSEGVFSLTMDEKEVSMILTESMFERHFSSLSTHDDHTPVMSVSDRYSIIRVDTENPGLNQHGILARITEVFAQYSISVFCLSTFSANYILIPSSDDVNERFRAMISATDWLRAYD